MQRSRPAHDILGFPIVDDAGEREELVVHAQRVVSSSTSTWAGPVNDKTPWIDALDLTQSLRGWIPFEDNQDLPAGWWRNDGDFMVQVIAGEEMVGQTSILIDLMIREAEIVDLYEPYESAALLAENSSLYYVLEEGDAGMARMPMRWWVHSPIRLNTPHPDTLHACTFQSAPFLGGRVVNARLRIWVLCQKKALVETSAFVSRISLSVMVISQHCLPGFRPG